ncbi:MAG: hypothetical protein MN733_13615 [Nitrososphaera sp.]|nr:hypothetical protein [Nitrososphaera sp.]
MADDNEIGRELGGKVAAKFQEIKRLAEDLEIEFKNGLSSNDHQISCVEQADRVADDILSSLKSASVMIN